MNRVSSRLMIVFAAALWGVIGVVYNRLASLGLRPVEIVLLRVLCAAVFMTVYIAVKDRSLFRIRLRDIWMFIGTGIVSLAFFNLCYFNAMNTMDLSVAATLLYTAPIFVMVLSSVCFRERFTRRSLSAVLAAFIGCVFVTGAFGGQRISFSGFLFGIGSGIGYALYSIFGVVALRRYRTETITLYTFWLAALGVLPFCRMSNMADCLFSKPTYSALLILCIGIGCCLLPYLLYTKGLCHTPPSEASIMATLEPVVAAVVGWLFLHETWAWTTIVGMILIIGSIVFINVPFRKKIT